MRQYVEQARALNEQILDTATKVGEDAVQRYVGWLQTIAEEQRKLASSPQVSEMDWFASMLKAQADFPQKFAKMVGRTSLGRQSQSYFATCRHGRGALQGHRQTFVRHPPRRSATDSATAR